MDENDVLNVWGFDEIPTEPFDPDTTARPVTQGTKPKASDENERMNELRGFEEVPYSRAER